MGVVTLASQEGEVTCEYGASLGCGSGVGGLSVVSLGGAMSSTGPLGEGTRFKFGGGSGKLRDGIFVFRTGLRLSTISLLSN